MTDLATTARECAAAVEADNGYPAEVKAATIASLLRLAEHIEGENRRQRHQ